VKWKRLGLVPLVLLIGSVVTLALFSLFARPPSDLGARDGRLAPCPDTLNCVCTQATDEAHRIEPITFDGTAEEAMARLKAALAALPRTRVVAEAPDYLHAECTSLLFRFVDDVEFLIDRERKVIHFRSASRVGRSDFGVNRRRMEALRQAFNGGGTAAGR
jgi:uncharacterized protein (DUF1499 family)